jgi:hypothetical protein
MVGKNLSLQHEFVCLTENPSGLDPNIKIIPLDVLDNVGGWWYKPMVFDPKLPLNGTVLFLDLDVVVFNSIDCLFHYEPGRFCIIEDYYAKRKGKHGMNSSCFRFEHGTNTQVYYDFIKNADKIMNRMHGDQDWMQEAITNFSFWPNNWILSYKWDMVKGELIRKGFNNKYVVNIVPTYTSDTCIAVFHGEPKPHQIENKWCQENWR